MSEQHWATPTYQSNLNAAIRDVAIRLSSGLLFESWLSLKTLYVLLPPTVENDVAPKYQKIEKAMQNVNNIKGTDYYDTKRIKAKESRAIMLNANFELFRAIKHSLYSKGWLENQGVKPRYNDVPEMDVEE